MLGRGQTRTKVYRSGRLTDTAFLIGYRNYRAQLMLLDEINFKYGTRLSVVKKLINKKQFNFFGK